MSSPESRPRLLDLFCGAGGAAMGYHRAGFDVVGVDLHDQPHYPFTFVRADALDIIDSWIDLSSFHAIHASPPCQHYSDLAGRNGNADEHPDLIAPTRGMLNAIGLPYVIENVEGAPLIQPYTVCGTAVGLGVDGYRLRRHRLFETSFPIQVPTCACLGDLRPIIDVSGGGPTHAPRLDGKGGRTYKGTVAEKRAVMGIDWMTGAELVESIPPAYTEMIGLSLWLHWHTNRQEAVAVVSDNLTYGSSERKDIHSGCEEPPKSESMWGSLIWGHRKQLPARSPLRRMIAGHAWTVRRG